MQAMVFAEVLMAVVMVWLVPVGVWAARPTVRTGAPSRHFLACCIAWGVSTVVTFSGLSNVFAGVPIRAAGAVFALVAGFTAASLGLRRLLVRPRWRWEEASLDAALLYLAPGSVWLAAFLADVPLLGFGGLWALLTAAHFHVAGFGLLALLGVAGRALVSASAPRALLRLHAVGVVALAIVFPIVGVGLTGVRTAELIGVIAYVPSSLIISVLLGWLILRGRATLPGWARAALVVPASTPLLTMSLAVGWGLRIPAVSLDTMLRLHAALNVVAWVGIGLTVLQVAARRTRETAWGIPFSRLRTTGPVGPRAVGQFVLEGLRAPGGLTDALSGYARDGFDPAKVAPSVRHFYENTGEYDMVVRAEWSRGFRLGGRLWSFVAQRVGQLGLPDGRSEEPIASRMVSIAQERDGRVAPRGWIRTYTRTGRNIYVAVYSEHRHAGIHYMNIAFPLPLSNLTSILRFEADDGNTPGGVSLTSIGEGDEGVYWITPLLPVRLPLNETIRVWSDTEGGLLATHEMWLWGMKFLDLQYELMRKQVG